MAHELRDARVVRARDELHRRRGEARLREARLHGRRERLVARERFLAAAQHDGVGGFQAQRRRVHEHIGTALEHHGDDAERFAHFFDRDAARPVARPDRFAHGVREPRHLANARNHVRKARVGERQAVHQRGREARRAGRGDVRVVRGADRRAVRFERGGDRLEGGVLLRGGEFAQFAGRGLGRGAQGRYFFDDGRAVQRSLSRNSVHSNPISLRLK